MSESVFTSVSAKHHVIAVTEEIPATFIMHAGNVLYLWQQTDCAVDMENVLALGQHFDKCLTDYMMKKLFA